jgi:hypothetical protein
MKDQNMKYMQPLISALFCGYGLYLIIHFIGHLGVTDLASIIIGITLLGVGAFGIYLFLKRLYSEKSKIRRQL